MAEKKAKNLCLRFVKAGSINVEAPRDWEKMTDAEKSMWANVHLETVDTEELYESLRSDEDCFCEAIENVENGYTADVPYTTLWSAYRNEVE